MSHFLGPPPPRLFGRPLNWWTDTVTPHLVQQRALPLPRVGQPRRTTLPFVAQLPPPTHHHRAPRTAPDWKQEADQSAVFRNRQEVRRLGGEASSL